ncbi:MAG TPA: c-type cytochrome [Porticoccus sp.]|nr:c-type cytochrome [Porticoccus sp.]
MLAAIVITLLVIASVVFHFLNPWQQTVLASNWGSMDEILSITFLVCGLFFVAIMFFLIYCLVRYRHREGHTAHHGSHNKKLEGWLIAVTSIGICALLAPGLVVYGQFVKPPDNAMNVEVLGQQWRWAFRFPGNDGLLGTTSVKHIGPKNQFGINPSDPNGQDDRLIHTNELRLPIDQPINFLLRSIDVLHNFYVPQLRSKMDLIPGIVTSFWATPTLLGRYQALCAELCGVGHYNMRGHLVVVSQPEFDIWLSQQPTFSEMLTSNTNDGLAEQGQQLAQNRGCIACHSVDGSKSLGPGWLGLYGTTETLSDGATLSVDAPYIKESIVNPSAKIVRGYPPVMVAYEFSEEQLSAITAYIQSLTSDEISAPQADTPMNKNITPQD